MPFEQKIVASPNDIDEHGHVNNAVWVRWIQDVAVAHWYAMVTPEESAGQIWVVIRHEIDYVGNLSAGDSVTARTWVPDPPRGAKFNRHMLFTGADGREKVRAISTWVMLDRASGRPMRIPSELAARFLES